MVLPKVGLTYYLLSESSDTASLVSNNKATGIPIFEELIEIKITTQILLYVKNFVYRKYTGVLIVVLGQK